jgi:Tfp pilus assembly protein PilO
MKQDTKRFTSMMMAGLLLAIALIVYFELVIPAYTDLQGVKGQLESEQTLYRNEQQIIGQVNAFVSSNPSNSSSSQLVALALPVGEDLSGAIAQIYGIAASTGITLQSTGISVEAVQPPPAPSTDASDTDEGLAATAAAGSVIKPTGSISFQLNGTGSYEAFKSFLQGIESNIRIFDVSAIQLEPVGTTEKTPQDLYNYSVTVTTYYQSQ